MLRNAIREIQPLWKTKLGQTISFSPDSKTLAVGGARGPVRLIETASGTIRVTCEGPKADIYSIAFSPDEKLVAIAPFNRRVVFCDRTSGKLLREIRLDDKEVLSLAFCLKTGDLLRTSQKETIEVIDPARATVTTVLEPDNNVHWVLQTSFFPKGDKLFVSWRKNTTLQEIHAGVFSWPNFKKLSFATHDFDLIYGASVAGNGRFVAASFSSYQPVRCGIALLDAKTCQLLRIILTESISCITFPSKHPWLIASSRNRENSANYIQFIDPESGKELKRFQTDAHAYSLCVSPDERFLAAATSGGVRVWDFQMLRKL